MPIEFTEDQLQDASDAALLKNFIDKLEGMLTIAVEGRIGDVDIRNQISDDRNNLREVLSDLVAREAFGAIKSLVQEEQNGLRMVGLTGRALRAKLRMISNASTPVTRGVRKALRYLLALINSVLGSLASGLGPVGGAIVHGIKELKELIEAKVNMVS